MNDYHHLTKGRGHIRKRGKYSFEIKWELARDYKTGNRRTQTKTIRGSMTDAIRVLESILMSRENLPSYAVTVNGQSRKDHEKRQGKLQQSKPY